MLIYNLFPLLAGPCGTWKPHFERAAAMGFDWVFVNPVQKARQSSGSLYSIADYFQTQPAARRPDLPSFPRRTAAQGRAGRPPTGSASRSWWTWSSTIAPSTPN
jgi:hypothetical protein